MVRRMEKIDIIELFKRVKEGKAPKMIEVNRFRYIYRKDETDIKYIYDADNGHTMWSEEITLDTKIKILDKPIIEELDTIIGDLENPTHNEILILNWIRNNRNKINEIINYINNNGGKING